MNTGYFSYYGVKNHTIAQVFGISENEVAEHLEDESIVLRSLEKKYQNRDINLSWVEEVPLEERDRMKHLFLEDEIPRVKREFLEGCMEYAQRPDKRLGYWQKIYLEELERKLKKLSMDEKVLVGKAEGVSTEKIAKAREFPITEILKTRKGMALCPFHNEKNPSMDVRKNFYYCYGCGETGDVIDLMMKMEHLTFHQAVERLN